jgi:hypothetical protein
VSCLLLIAASIVGIVVMIVSVRALGGPAGFAISTCVDMCLFGGWLAYIWWRDRRRDARELAELDQGDAPPAPPL